MFRRLRALQIMGLGLGLAASLALTGCGGDEDPPAGGASPTGGSGGGAGNATQAADYDQMVEYTKCMRGQGLDMPDPKPGEGPQSIMAWVQNSGVEPSRFRQANAACQDKLPSGIRDRAGSQDTQERMLKFAQCMRDNGVNMPDPKGGQLDFGSLDRNSPQYKDAEAKCRKSMSTGQGG
jgi:hypothetical protein